MKISENDGSSCIDQYQTHHRYSYGSSDLTLFPPPFPISRNDPIITVYLFACTLCPDHYKIPHAEGTIGIGVLVKAKT
jgi:hypothetical protein